MFCPECQAEYREGFTRCADCEVDLVDSLPVSEEPVGPLDLHLVRLWRGADPVLYSVLIAALKEASIPFFDNPARDYENWLSAREWTGLNAGVPNYDVQVAEPRFAEAVEILQALLEQGEAAGENAAQEEGA